MPEADQPLAEIKVAKKERNNYYCYYSYSLTLYELIYQHHFQLIFSVTFYFEATRMLKKDNDSCLCLVNKSQHF